MLLLAGLMGILAVGATVLVGLETLSKRDADQQDETPETSNEPGEPAADLPGDEDDLIDAAVALVEAVPAIPDTMRDAASETEPEDIDAWLLGSHDIGTDGPGDPREELHAWQAQEADRSQPWLAQAHQDQVSDFSAQEDRLVIVYDDRAGPAPHVGLEPDDDDATRLHVTLDGIRITAVDRAEGLTLDHILLVAESAIPNAAAA